DVRRLRQPDIARLEERRDGVQACHFVAARLDRDEPGHLCPEHRKQRRAVRLLLDLLLQRERPPLRHLDHRPPAPREVSALRKLIDEVTVRPAPRPRLADDEAALLGFVEREVPRLPPLLEVRRQRFIVAEPAALDDRALRRRWLLLVLSS